ncbi:CBO0543 family protein [Sporosarcina ureilytica]|uniref:CBO0543 family protein n=1 Tax=Sporosarcina ureilytica TaxID=298596 RepID=UPI002480E58F|nr:CBO0543 family protein [Sporosarcina ureilytica]
MKHSNASSLPPSLKKQSFRNLISYVSAVLFASLCGTYLDLYFVGKGFYTFPTRPFPEIFSINILFTIVILPFLTLLYLYLIGEMSRRGRLVFTLIVSGFVPFFERRSIQLGFLQVEDQWNHLYSFFGYFLFMVLIWKIFKWTLICLGRQSIKK